MHEKRMMNEKEQDNKDEKKEGGNREVEDERESKWMIIM
jgi:hypothetical protein